MLTQEKLQDKREAFRVSIRRSHNEDMRRRRRAEIIQEGDYSSWLQAGIDMLAELNTLLNSQTAYAELVLRVVKALKQSLEYAPDSGRQAFVNENNCVKVVWQVTHLMQRFSTHAELRMEGFNVVAVIAGMCCFKSARVSIGELLYSPASYLRQEIAGGFICSYLSFIGNILVVDKTPASVVHLLEKGMISALLEFFSNKMHVYCFRELLTWFLVVLFNEITRFRLEGADANLPKLLALFSDLAEYVLNNQQIGEFKEDSIHTYLKCLIKMSSLLRQQIPAEVVHYLELSPLNGSVVKLLANLTYVTVSTLSDIRIRQLIDSLFQWEQLDENALFALTNNITNEPSSRHQILRELLRPRENVSPIKSFVRTSPLIHLYYRIKETLNDTRNFLKLLLTMIDAEGALGVLEDCVGSICVNEVMFEQELLERGYVFE